MPVRMHLAVGQHDLHAALHAHVDPVGHVRRAVVERVADHAPPPEIGDREHQPVPAGLDRLVEVEPAHAGLHDGVGALLVDLEHAVHPPQAHDHRAAHARSRPAVAVVAAGPVRPQRHAVLVGQPHDRLDLLDARRHHHRRGRVVVPRRVRERVAELAQVGLAGQDLLGAERGGERVDGAREPRLVDARRQRPRRCLLQPGHRLLLHSACGWADANPAAAVARCAVPWRAAAGRTAAGEEAGPPGSGVWRSAPLWGVTPHTRGRAALRPRMPRAGGCGRPGRPARR